MVTTNPGAAKDDRRPDASFLVRPSRVDRASWTFGGRRPKFDMSGMSVFPIKFVSELCGVGWRVWILVAT